VGFEPTFAFTKTVFKTVAIVHSATPPQTVLVYEIELSLATIRVGWRMPLCIILREPFGRKVNQIISVADIDSRTAGILRQAQDELLS
jgi:hypothetical protein